MKEKKDNPLDLIFIKNSKGKTTEEINDIEQIPLFFNYLKSDEIEYNEKIFVIEELIKKFKINRYITEYFSEYESSSIYIFLFDLYLKKDTKQELKTSIINLLNELRINIQTGKEIYEYLFQKLSSLYRGEEDLKSNNMKNYLTLLYTILNETENCIKPRNYFSCNGNGRFILDFNQQINIGYSFTIIMNFKISKNNIFEEGNELKRISNLVSINFSNNTSISVDLEYPLFLVLKEVKAGFIKQLPKEEWINLVITFVIESKTLKIGIHVNGENNDSNYSINQKNPLKPTDSIVSVEFFNKFYGEVSSMTMFSQKEQGKPGAMNKDFLMQFNQFKGGLWKKKNMEKFIDILKRFNSIDKGVDSLLKTSTPKANIKNEEKKVSLFDNLLFVFTPFNCYNTQLIEDYFGRQQLILNGDIKNHRYQCYQKKLSLVCNLSNFFPIAEMFLIHPELLNEENFELFLQIINNILKDRKENIKAIKEWKVFKIISLFIEKYPNHLFTEKILNVFFEIGKTIFKNNLELLCANYFKNILLNEKILSKYNENLQVIFWNNMFKFCESDKSQIETFINMNRLCLILRFYDKNKYTEMCCEEHLNAFKDQFVGSKKIMNPPMNKKLSYLKNIMDLIIIEQEPKNAVNFFKLLTLDLSPCLIKFIINIFISAFKNDSSENKNWTLKLIQELFNSKIEVIITNTFNHSLPEIRLDIIKFIYVIYQKLLLTNKLKYFKRIEKMIKTCLLPQNMFYENKIHIYSKPKNDEEQKNEDENKNEELIRAEKRRATKIVTKMFANKLIEKTKARGESDPKDDKKKYHNIKSNNIRNKINIFSGTEKDKDRKDDKNDFKPVKLSNNFMSLVSKFDKGKDNNEIGGDIKKVSTYSKVNKNNEKKTQIKEVEKNKIINRPQKNDSILNNTAVINYDFKKKLLDKVEENQKIKNLDLQKIEEEKNIKETEQKIQILDKEVLVIKDEVYNNYLNSLFSMFLSWIYGNIIDNDNNKRQLDTSTIRNINGLQLLSALASDLKDNKYIEKYLNIIINMINIKENAYILLSDQKIMNSLFNISLNYYILINDKNNNNIENKNYYELSKSVIVSLFINSMIHIETQQNMNIFPSEKLEVIFIWGNKLLSQDENLQTKEVLFEYLSEILFELINNYTSKYEKKLSSISPIENQKSNYYFKNYLILITKLFQYSFLFKLDSAIKANGLSFMCSFSPTIDLPSFYLSSMRIGYNTGKQIKEYWMDYKYFDEIYKRIRQLWKMEKLYKGHDLKKIDKNNKYEYILKNIILVKEKKNIYQTELEFLCQEEVKDENEIIICPLKIIIITLMSILSVINNSKDENDMLYWLKEFKYFIKFIIIASSNMTKINQLEVYNYIQDKCLVIITLGLCFMKNMINSAVICKDKISKYFSKIFNFCINIVYYQYDYNDRHKLGKKVFSFAARPARNDLSKCAVFLLFTEYVKDKTGNILLSPQNKKNYLNQNENIINLINNKDWNDALFQNQTLKSKINKNIFDLNLYEKNVKNRFNIIEELNKDYDTSYKKIILELLPNYEQELLKYSNNSLEKNVKKKNQYKRFKIQCFSWKGFWSDRKMFFCEGGPKFKLKLVNHYTKSFMKPILVPILDIDYYLPSFSDFDTSKLFSLEGNKTENKFILNLDIDKILKLSEQNKIALKNIQKTFGQNKQSNILKENYLRSIYIKSNKDLAENLFKISNKLDFGKEEEFTLIEKNKSSKSKKKYYLSCIVKTSHHIKGVCFIDNTKLNFKVFLNQKTGNAMSGVEIGFTNQDDDYDPERQTCFGSYFVCHPKDKDLYKVSINYSDIKWIFRRRYYYKNSAMEIFTITNKTFYFNFKYEEDRETVINQICSKLKEPNQIIDDLKETKDIFGNIIGFENTSVFPKKKKKKKEKIDKKFKLSKIIKDWRKWKITNFEFLMWLNIFSNRSYNDISQYPVFPWILSSYEDPLQREQKKILAETRNNTAANLDQSFVSLNTTLQDFNEKDETIIDYLYRDLSSPMGMLELSEEGIKRKELFMETYDTLKNEKDEENEIKPYIYGSNYSNPVYVCNYLMRLFPFTHISIELQGHGFDKPDRLFLSVANSFNNSTTQKTDVRELIPEFFYLPEMFLNINNLNMGILENGKRVDNVNIPCDNNPYDFIMVMKSVLENNKLSNSIQNWIDLIFGSKVKGKEAENANNIFTEASYQENIDLNKIENKESYLRLVEFGLIPNQILSKDCSKREKKTDILKGKQIMDQTANIKIEKCKLHFHFNNNENEYNKKNNSKNHKKEELFILKIDISSEEKISIVLNNDYLVEKRITKNALDKSYSDETLSSKKLNKVCNRMFIYQYPKTFNDKTLRMYEEGKSMVIGGYYDGKIIIINTEPKLVQTEMIPFNEEEPICAITISKDEDYMFLGNMKGNIKVYKNDFETKTWEPLYQLNDQMKEITYFDCNNKLNLWASSTIDGYINLYSFPQCKLFRSIKVPTKNCNYIFLSSSPLPSIIVITYEKKESEIFVYSINGYLILRQKEQGNISSPIIFKDLNSNDYLAYISNGSIFIRSLPNLILHLFIEDLQDIYTIFTNKNKTILYAANKSASEINIIKHESKKMFISNMV